MNKDIFTNWIRYNGLNEIRAFERIVESTSEDIWGAEVIRYRRSTGRLEHYNLQTWRVAVAIRDLRDFKQFIIDARSQLATHEVQEMLKVEGSMEKWDNYIMYQLSDWAYSEDDGGQIVRQDKAGYYIVFVKYAIILKKEKTEDNMRDEITTVNTDDKILDLVPTNHSYYCSDSNYYVDGYDNYGRCDYDSWKEFKQEWVDTDGSLDDDLNHLFRFDIVKEDGIEKQGFTLWLFFILQRKGIYTPVQINNITQDDMPEITAFLRARWSYLQKQWKEFNK